MPRALANTCAECGLPSRQHAHAAGHCYMFGHSDSGRVSDVITALELKGVSQPVTVGFSGKLLLAFYQNYLSFFNFMKNEALPNILLVINCTHINEISWEQLTCIASKPFYGMAVLHLL